MIIDLMHAVTTDHPDIDFLWPGGPMVGTVGALVAPGGSGKSMWALQAAIAVAGGPDTLGLCPRYHGQVLYLSAEDPALIIMRRLRAIAKSVPADPAIAFGDAVERLFIQVVVGERINLLDDRHVISIAKQCEGVRLVILDTLTRLHQGDENSNADMSKVIGALEHVAAKSGAAVIYLHHTNKLAALNGMGDLQQAARGASALIDNARWCGYVSRMSKDEAGRYTESINLSDDPIDGDSVRMYVRQGVSKHNYDAIPAERWYKWINGSLAPVTLYENKKKKGKNREEL